MEWTVVFYAIFVASVLSLVGVSVAGWRRPSRRVAEALGYSLLFFAVILFMVILAANLWVPAMGPVFLGVRWLSLLLVALLIALLIGVVMSASSLESEDVSDLGLGLALWLFLGALFAMLVAGALRH